MVERKHSGTYEVNERQPNMVEIGWCSNRFIVYMAALSAFILYIIGAVITGFAYRGPKYECSDLQFFKTTEVYVFHTPLVVVGPCLMSGGGSVLVYLLFQWFLCRPALM